MGQVPHEGAMGHHHERADYMLCSRSGRWIAQSFRYSSRTIQTDRQLVGCCDVTTALNHDMTVELTFLF